MSYNSVGGEAHLGAGKIWFDRFDTSGVTTGLRMLGACEQLSLVPGNIETREKKDPTQAGRPTLVSAVIGQTHQIRVSMLQLNADNLALFTMGTAGATSQTGAAVVDESIVCKGKDTAYHLSKVQIDSGVAPVLTVGGSTKTLGTDYTLDYDSGLLIIPSGSTIAAADTMLIDYTYKTFSKKTISGAVLGKITGALTFTSDPTAGEKWNLRVWKCSAIPDGELSLIGEDWVAYNLLLTIESDATNHPTEPNYRLEKVN